MGISKTVCLALLGGGSVGGGSTCLALNSSGYFQKQETPRIEAEEKSVQETIQPKLGESVDFNVTVNSETPMKLECDVPDDSYPLLWMDWSYHSPENWKLECAPALAEALWEPFELRNIDERTSGIEGFQCKFLGLEEEVNEAKRKTYRYDCTGGKPLVKGKKNKHYIELSQV
ncbi:hypothetical protein MHLP_03925 [Candidatus Mycoplasma haematolamae str. Purdue]|uniref:Uncharacterized protein n=1 Tax=Mycoplasma haematolamae (strain Purdue) TaxID=1212765 RepID=I7BAL7_MYCHA|nr:hypothetical protein [Candidatus Mycoplasma haematolamae]AFO52365.1 hypothetical protein MHLP_03925 [Candidatus Mycoplasma haematolamae str. Purdue]